MYQFPNQQVYHHNHIPYQQCQLGLGEPLKHNLNGIPEPPPQYCNPIPENVNNAIINEQIPNETVKELLPQEGLRTEKKKRSPRKKKDEGQEEAGEDKKRKKERKSGVDTSTFSVEERLVAAVWVHERAHTNSTISEIKHNFRRRFGREPPSKTTLFAWERKLFSTGNVCDAPRTGRPVNRKSHISEVAASIRAAPSLSLRARALALQVPRTTLHNILRKDLPYTAVKDKIDKARSAVGDKQQCKRRVKQSPAKLDAPPPAPHMHYAMHSVHAHNHPYS